MLRVSAGHVDVVFNVFRREQLVVDHGIRKPRREAVHHRHHVFDEPRAFDLPRRVPELVRRYAALERDDMLSIGRKRVVVVGRHDRGQKRLRGIPAVFRFFECALQEFRRRANVSVSGILDTGLLL